MQTSRASRAAEPSDLLLEAAGSPRSLSRGQNRVSLQAWLLLAGPLKLPQGWEDPGSPVTSHPLSAPRTPSAFRCLSTSSPQSAW